MVQLSLPDVRGRRGGRPLGWLRLVGGHFDGHAAPQSPGRARPDERKEMFAYTAGLFAGIPLAAVLLLLLTAFPQGLIGLVAIYLALLVGLTELGQWLLLRSVYFGSDGSGPFYAVGFRARSGGDPAVAARSSALGPLRGEPLARHAGRSPWSNPAALALQVTGRSSPSRPGPSRAAHDPGRSRRRGDGDGLRAVPPLTLGPAFGDLRSRRGGGHRGGRRPALTARSPRATPRPESGPGGPGRPTGGRRYRAVAPRSGEPTDDPEDARSPAEALRSAPGTVSRRARTSAAGRRAVSPTEIGNSSPFIRAVSEDPVGLFRSLAFSGALEPPVKADGRPRRLPNAPRPRHPEDSWRPRWSSRSGPETPVPQDPALV